MVTYPFVPAQTKKMLGVGFEPTHPEILELESSALDRSAIQALLWVYDPTTLSGARLSFWQGKIKSGASGFRSLYLVLLLPIELMTQKPIPGGT